MNLTRSSVMVYANEPRDRTPCINYKVASITSYNAPHDKKTDTLDAYRRKTHAIVSATKSYSANDWRRKTPTIVHNLLRYNVRGNDK